MYEEQERRKIARFSPFSRESLPGDETQPGETEWSSRADVRTLDRKENRILRNPRHYGVKR